MLSRDSYRERLTINFKEVAVPIANQFISCLVDSFFVCQTMALVLQTMRFELLKGQIAYSDQIARIVI